MSEVTPSTNTLQEPLIATTNFALPKLKTVCGSPEDYGDFLEQTGYTGKFEIHPIRSRFVISLRRGSVVAHELVSSYHQSFMGETPGRALRHLNDLPELARYLPALVALPHVEASMDTIEHMREPFEKDSRPTVVYALPAYSNQQTFYNKYTGPLLVQPKARYMTDWGIDPNNSSATQELDAKIKKQGFGICLDLTHWLLPEGGITLPNWNISFPILMEAGGVSELHIGPYRPDLGVHKDPTQLRQILKGQIARTVLGQQLTLLKESSPLPRIVIEIIPSQALAGIDPAQRTGKSNAKKDLTGVHRDLVSAVREHITLDAA